MMIDMCDGHWTALRSEVEAQGMSALVPESGEQAQRAMVRRDIEGVTVDSFDPLIGALMAIVEQLMMRQARVNGCPICFLNTNCTCPKTLCGEDWINHAVTEQREIWESL